MPHCSSRDMQLYHLMNIEILSYILNKHIYTCVPILKTLPSTDHQIFPWLHKIVLGSKFQNLKSQHQAPSHPAWYSWKSPRESF